MSIITPIRSDSHPRILRVKTTEMTISIIIIKSHHPKILLVDQCIMRLESVARKFSRRAHLVTRTGNLGTARIDQMDKRSTKLPKISRPKTRVQTVNNIFKTHTWTWSTTHLQPKVTWHKHINSISKSRLETTRKTIEVTKKLWLFQIHHQMQKGQPQSRILTKFKFWKSNNCYYNNTTRISKEQAQTTGREAPQLSTTRCIQTVQDRWSQNNQSIAQGKIKRDTHQTAVNSI